MIGNTSYGPSVLDLDTGELVAAPKAVAAVEPLMVSGEWLVARNSGRMVAVPADDLAAEPTVLLPEGEGGWIDLASRAARSDGRAWMVVYGTIASFVFVGGSDWLLLVWFEPNGVTVELFDVVSGRTQELGPNQYEYYGMQPAVSPDGRWLASIEATNLVILELDTGEEWTSDYRGADRSMVFTTAEVGYATPPVDSGE